MKVQSSVKPRCPHCKVVVRKKRMGGTKVKRARLKRVVYIICSANPKLHLRPKPWLCERRLHRRE